MPAGDAHDGPSTDRKPSFCHNCGSELTEDHNYCAQCGTRVRTVNPARETTDPDSDGDASAEDASAEATADEDGTEDRTDIDEDMAAFRRRVQDRLVEGYEIEHDYGDSVVLVNRSLGSAGMHLLVAFFTIWFTGGIGNLLYAGYKYFVDTDRIVLRADGTDGPTASTDVADVTPEDVVEAEQVSGKGSTGRVLAGLFLFLVGFAAIAENLLDPGTLVFGLGFLLAGLYVFPATRQRLDDRSAVTDFGRVQSTEESVVRDPDTPCSICYDPIEEGVERRYRERMVVAGVPLFTTEEGENHYCRACAAGEVPEMSVDDESAETETPAGAAEASDAEPSASEDEAADEEWSSFEPASVAARRGGDGSSRPNGEGDDASESESDAETVERSAEPEVE